ncbi:hypothetical protein Hanom_Chr15g01370861 [Helianthus anomalus]
MGCGFVMKMKMMVVVSLISLKMMMVISLIYEDGDEKPSRERKREREGWMQWVLLISKGILVI